LYRFLDVEMSKVLLRRKMAVEVILNVFSGRPDPRWTLSAAQVAKLAPMLGRALAAPHSSARPPASLGYRGFTIDHLDGLTAGPVHVYRGNVHFASGKVSHVGPEIERFLLRCTPRVMEPSIKQYVQAEITTG
jgi:hypothetical protein